MYFKLPSKTAIKQSDTPIEHTSSRLNLLLGLSVEESVTEGSVAEGTMTRLAVVLSAIDNKMLKRHENIDSIIIIGNYVMVFYYA